MDFNNAMWNAVVTIFVAIIGVASLAVFLSRKSNTAAIIQNTASGVGNALAAAEAPVTGQQLNSTFTYASSNNGLLTDAYSA